MIIEFSFDTFLLNKQSMGDTNAVFEQDEQQTPRVITYQYGTEL